MAGPDGGATSKTWPAGSSRPSASWVRLALRLAPVRARAAAGFDYFAIGVPGKTALDGLATRLTALGEDHDGVHFASIGWILPQLHDPDGHEVRFYTIEQHTGPRAPGIITIEDPRETAERREREWRAVGTAPGRRAGAG